MKGDSKSACQATFSLIAIYIYVAQTGGGGAPWEDQFVVLPSRPWLVPLSFSFSSIFSLSLLLYSKHTRRVRLSCAPEKPDLCARVEAKISFFALGKIRREEKRGRKRERERGERRAGDTKDRVICVVRHSFDRPCAGGGGGGFLSFPSSSSPLFLPSFFVSLAPSLYSFS